MLWTYKEETVCASVMFELVGWYYWEKGQSLVANKPVEKGQILFRLMRRCFKNIQNLKKKKKKLLHAQKKQLEQLCVS